MSESRITSSAAGQRFRAGSSHLYLLRAGAQPRPIAVDTTECCLCEVCGEVIGVYEPLVMCTSREERTTSRAAEPELSLGDGVCYHRECHAEAAAFIAAAKLTHP
jgi:hypothetical protein